MSEKINHIKSLIKVMGFVPEENSSGIFHKKYNSHKNYIIKIHVEKGEIDYGNKITLGDKTTSNFKAYENFVVLECVDRILTKGYPPESITLEKDYPLGHKTKGKLDILVSDKEGKSYLMIECKTWSEYEKAVKKTLSDGGQLLSYFQQDTSSKYLSLYTSKLDGYSIAYKNGIIKVEDDFLQATNTQEVFEKWNKNLKDNGIFEEWAKPYDISIKAITKGSLNPLTKEDSGRIFNQFAEILRHNVVSDKPNAFNKLITLLLCKIVDEDKADSEELHFQWLENDTDIDLQKRLNDLYKTGMQKYLTKVVTDYSDTDVEEIVGLNEKQKDIIKKMMTELRLKKNNEFAFKEVYNDASFIENGKVLKEVVELLQSYQVRYNKKQQFLGDFFELLLNTSIKQEAGQFFTPVPIARFIISSIPLRKIILDKIKNDEPEFLPYVIDYAVGSGHFLTEAMDEIHNAIVDFNDSGDFKPSVKKKLSSWAENAAFDWAYNFVYGVEKDYRLVKTAKVSCFLNGDGLARIFNADGLGSFETDPDYQDRLKVISKADSRDNLQFEVLIANPPYSVSAFKNTLKNGDKSFELFDRLTEDSSEIECLFIERTKQLLKEDGYAGIILPSSILSNSGIYSAAREILLKYFKIIAITEFGSNTFMATDTNTVTLFLKKRNHADWQKIQHTVNNFFLSPVDVSCNGIEAPFTKYIAHVYKTISFEDYVTLVKKNPNEKMKENDLYKEYHKEFYNSTFVKNLLKKPVFKSKSESEQQGELERIFYTDVFAKENEKILFFILAFPQKTLLIKANPDGKNETEREFLGYEFSNRRGHEGIRPYGAKTIQEGTKLYDETNLLNPEKVNSHIHNAFFGNKVTIDESLQNHIINLDLVDMIQWDRIDFQKSISLSTKKKSIDYTQIWGTQNLVSLNEIATILKGKSITKSETKKGSIPVIAGGKEPAYFHNIANRTGDIITVSASGANAGFINFFTQDIFASDCNTIQSKDEKVISTKFLYYYLNQIQNVVYTLQRGQAQPHVYADDLEGIKIPLPAKGIQDKIVKEFEAIDLQEKKDIEEIDLLNKNLYQQTASAKGAKPTTISNICDIKGGKRIPLGSTFSNKKTEYPYIRVTDFNNLSINFNSLKYITEEVFNSIKNYTISKDDVYISIAGTIGLVGLVPEELHNKSLTENAAKLVIKDKELVDKKYLMYCMASYDAQEQIKDRIKSLGTPKLALNRIETIKILLPPISEQRKILLEIEKIEVKIATIKKHIAGIATKKQEILTKYL